ncbi:hypothetical protein CspeluHIS016_0803080 [Cutaneotrichosporon spelunceum]|uniref:Uncharacterized protein n=1 Tax=Cutaneotrichosporon spelunceum TaxID=1672016 RepID=A0AAD3TZJ8_9TREE|nr:hypothetical protein CspeluHIS016_0803080 [Cutaneotrichosporon spelunceum]
MIDFLRSQTPQSPVNRQSRPLSVVDALRQTNTYTYTALPLPPFEPLSPKSFPPPTAAIQSRPSDTPSPSPKKAAPKLRAKRDTLATLFRWTEPTPELRPLLLAPMARPAEPNPSRPRFKDDEATRIAAAAESRLVPIGGARAARLRSQRKMEERLGRGRPALSLDIDSELSYEHERERVTTPVESVFVARELERDSWLKR